MYQQTPINCHKCGRQVSTQENESGMYRDKDVKCPYCGEVAISVPKVIC